MMQRMFALVGRTVNDTAPYHSDGLIIALQVVWIYIYSSRTENAILDQPETGHERGRSNEVGKPVIAHKMHFTQHTSCLQRVYANVQSNSMYVSSEQRTGVNHTRYR